MEFFGKYTSNTAAGTHNQHTFHADGECFVGRAFYKILFGGEYGYSLLFSNITDSTISESLSEHANLVCPPWKIHSAKIGRCIGGVSGEITELCAVTFDGKPEKSVAPGEFFSTDPVRMYFDAGDHLCLEMTFSGKVMPYHHEAIIPIFRKCGNEWITDKRMPLPGMVGCDRSVKGRIAYIGDSITQGIGTEADSYTHWNSVLAKLIGDGYSHWNLGIGCARAADTASDGAWMYKAKNCDIAVVCIGTNDVLNSLPEEQIGRNIARTAELLTSEGKAVVLQTIPPFEYSEHHIPVWKRLNEMIKTELADKASLVFDVGEAIGTEGVPHLPLYGGHPNAEGCRIWAEKLYSKMKKKGII